MAIGWQEGVETDEQKGERMTARQTSSLADFALLASFRRPVSTIRLMRTRRTV